MERPLLNLNLSGPDGNIFTVIGHARVLLTGHKLLQFNMDVGYATLLRKGTTYEEVLEIVNRYVRLVDRSGMYPQYTSDKEAIRTAIDMLNEGMQTLPEELGSVLYGMYPDYDYPESNEYVYYALLLSEIESVKQQREQAQDKEPLGRLLTMLQECASALQRAGIA